MTIKLKIFFVAAASAVLLCGIGYFAFYVAKNVPKSGKVPEQKVDEFAKWQTYYGGPKGFEIKIPPEWSKNFDHDGYEPKLEDRFWRDQVGRAGFLASATATNTAKFSVLIKDSDLTMEEFAENVIASESAEDFLLNNLSAKKSVEDGRDQKTPSYRERVLIKNGKRYYFLDFSTSSGGAGQEIIIWNKILGTFKPESD